MTLISGFMVFVNDEPTKMVAESFEAAKSIALQSVTDTNRVEIKTTDGLVVTWRYNNETKQFDEIS